MTDAVSGEQVAYQYDTLKRLTRAETVGPQWGLEFLYDGFGNRRLVNLIKGQSGPATNFQFDWKNQISDPGFHYDANGNLTNRPDGMTFTYDVENRLRIAGSEVYEHHPLTGQRICSANCQKLFFYGPTGERLGTYNPYVSQSQVAFGPPEDETVYFAGRLLRSQGKWLVRDRVGSVVANSTGERFGYFPYGEERTPSANDRDRFATYLRDSNGLDYAQQRYYDSTRGRFISPDQGPALPTNPASWNPYSYGWGDPVNMNDPGGTLPMNVDYQYGCVPKGSPLLAGGMIDASNPCPPGFTAGVSIGDSGSLTWTQQAQILFSGMDPAWIGDWDYTRTPFKYQIFLTEEQYEYLGAMGFLNAGVIVQQIPRYWDRAVILTAGAIALLKEILRTQKPLPTIDFLKGNCNRGRFVSEPATGRNYAGGTSFEQEYICPEGLFTVHWIERNGLTIHGPHVRPGAPKGGGVD